MNLFVFYIECALYSKKQATEFNLLPVYKIFYMNSVIDYWVGGS